VGSLQVQSPGSRSPSHGSGDWFGLSLGYGILKHERPRLLTRIRSNGKRFDARGVEANCVRGNGIGICHLGETIRLSPGFPLVDNLRCPTHTGRLREGHLHKKTALMNRTTVRLWLLLFG